MNKKALIMLLLIMVLSFSGCAKNDSNIVLPDDNIELPGETQETTITVPTEETTVNTEVTTEATTEVTNAVNPAQSQPNYYKISEISFEHVKRFNDKTLSITMVLKKDIGAEQFASIIPIVGEDDKNLDVINDLIFLASSENGVYFYETMIEEPTHVKFNKEETYPFRAVVIAPAFETAVSLKIKDVKNYLPKIKEMSSDNVIAVISLDGDNQPEIVVYEVIGGSSEYSVKQVYYFFDPDDKNWYKFKEKTI